MCSVPETPIRLFVGPANFAAQGFRLARAAERIDGVGAVNMQRILQRGYNFPADLQVPQRVYKHSLRWQRKHFEHISRNFTHVILEAELPLFGGFFGGDVVAEIAALRARGVSVALLSHGTDLRGPDLHASRDPASPFNDQGHPEIARLRAVTTRNRSVLARAAAPVFVTTPDLLMDWPAAEWIPVVIDPELWHTDKPVLQAARPRVVHAPTNPWIKGSELIEPMLLRLHEEGIIEYQQLVDIPADEMPAVYHGADIVLEQFRIGTYSVTAVEALAAGRIVVAHLFDDVRAHVENAVSRELPVIEATVETLEATLREVCSDPVRFVEHAAVGPDFVREVHDGRRSAALLEAFLH
ncbi:glycosyltransferase family 1 protein [Salinibacterium sp. UTAS2018]|uniref:glycosyltransferase n=1 Tax=Salinibacterium sp. UTAS2018 TaxID=2508880 RepID=UPI0010096230|nr:glycosyltransferase [Salinibacterium sp. UTAS2018]QAV69972.1 glycosyltransferase family 1 protein [Salinibacterium sp. UTAS2018]